MSADWLVARGRVRRIGCGEATLEFTVRLPEAQAYAMKEVIEAALAQWVQANGGQYISTEEVPKGGAA